MDNDNVEHARFSRSYRYIIDTNGEKLKFNDPRINHIWTFDMNSYSLQMIENVFKKRGCRVRTTGRRGQKALQNATKLCSGRECLSCTAYASAILEDLSENYNEEEIFIYYYLDQEGPCQNGAWKEMWKVFADKLQLKNAIFIAYPHARNNYLGQGNQFAQDLTASVVLGDLFSEAGAALRCTAKDKEAALMQFQTETGKVIKNMRYSRPAVRSALRKWAKNISKIPQDRTVAEVPKVFIMGTGEAEFLYHPVSDYFFEYGIIPKVLDMTGFIYLLAADPVTRHAFSRKRVKLNDQKKKIPFAFTFLPPFPVYRDFVNIVRSLYSMYYMDYVRLKYALFMKRSGLLFNKFASSLGISLEGDKYATVNAGTETFFAIGRYIVSEKSGIFDGILNLSTFNCQPSINAQAIIRPLANNSNVPYAAIDMEGPWLDANQIRILETLAVQAKRVHSMRK